MIFRLAWAFRTLFLAYLFCASLAEIAPRAGSGSGAGGRPSKPGLRPEIHGGSDGGKLSNLRRFPRPHVEGDEIGDAESVFSLGSFAEDEQVLFENFDGPSLPFFSKMYDFFYAKETYLHTQDAYAEATGENNPFPDDSKSRPTGNRLTLRETLGPKEARRTITSTWNPAKPTDVCYAWSSLHAYCDGAGIECACSSSKYYVPAQYNALAADCARVTTKCSDENGAVETDAAWCEIGKTAASYSNYCDDAGATPVKFAARANSKAQPTFSPDDSPAPSDPGDAPGSNEPDDAPGSQGMPVPQDTPTPIAEITPALTTTPGPDDVSDEPAGTPISADICTMSFIDGTPQSALSFISSSCQNRDATPTGSWAPTLPRPITRNIYGVAITIAAILLS